MVAVPALTTQLVNGAATSAWANTVRDAVSFVTVNRPLAVLRQTVAQNLTTGVFASITFDVEDLDRDGGHSTVTNTSRYTAVTAGWYTCSGAAGFTVSGTGRRGTRWAVNGSVLNASLVVGPASAASTTQTVAVTRVVFLNVGDYVELQAIQESGGTLATAVSADNQSMATIAWEGS